MAIRPTLKQSVAITRGLVARDIQEMVHVDGNDAIEIARRVLVEPRWSVLYVAEFVHQVWRDRNLDDEQREEIFKVFFRELTRQIYIAAESS